MNLQGEAIFDWICKQPDDVAAVAGLDDSRLRALARFLGAFSCETGIPGTIMALVVGEMARRFFLLGKHPHPHP